MSIILPKYSRLSNLLRFKLNFNLVKVFFFSTGGHYEYSDLCETLSIEIMQCNVARCSFIPGYFYYDYYIGFVVLK